MAVVEISGMLYEVPSHFANEDRATSWIVVDQEGGARYLALADRIPQSGTIIIRAWIEISADLVSAIGKPG